MLVSWLQLLVCLLVFRLNLLLLSALEVWDQVRYNYYEGLNGGGGVPLTVDV